ncbi:DUF2505 domain-containing protein [Mycobacterium sp. 236(2023)]|uniref:DUF2505 domain-containing protein n=1 Tax=Mycobacterium sp. 236(2023) TaxID=3038163 RepID=UPI002415289F|nr:DUF2505 domain-containing protein [Mycobacterium sp. 236(2023)]MDG4666910.1 DUF2505 domain-containing protein [Mycobacterium sp. 236(2023)]
MPSPFEVQTDSPAGVDAILAAFGDAGYWNDRIAEFGGGATTLDRLDVDADGAVDVATTQDLRNDLLPGPLTKVFRGNLSIVRAETWKRGVADDVRGVVTISASGVPGSGEGHLTLTPQGEGSRLTFTGTVEVKIPLVGGRFEKAICDQIVAELPQLTRFTSDWIAQNG